MGCRDALYCFRISDGFSGRRPTGKQLAFSLFNLGFVWFMFVKLLCVVWKVSCLWQGQHLLTVSLSGFIAYLDVNNPDKPIRVVKVSVLTAPFFSQIICMTLSVSLMK